MNKKYRVLMVHNYYQIPGGEDTVVANEKRLLEEHGHTVILYTRNNTELKELSLMGKMLLPITTLFNPKTYKEVKKIIKENHIDLVHVHNTLNLVSPAVYYAAFSCKVPVVQTVHNFRLLCPGATFYRNGRVCEDCVTKGLGCAVKHGCYRDSRLQTLACVISTWVHRMLGTYGKLNYICLTEFNKQKLLQLKQIQKERVFVKPNFTYSNDLKRKMGDYYLFIGRIEKIKGTDKIVEAFSQMPDKTLLLAGEGPLLDTLEKTYMHCSNIRFLGFLKHKKIELLLSEAKAVVVDSQWYETFGMIVIEAYASGVPVIVGNIGNVGDLVIDGITGMKFQYDSVSSLMKTVEAFEKKEMDWEYDCRKIFEQCYSPQQNGFMLQKIYHQVTMNSNPKGKRK